MAWDDMAPHLSCEHDRSVQRVHVGEDQPLVSIGSVPRAQLFRPRNVAHGVTLGEEKGGRGGEREGGKGGGVGRPRE